LGEPGGHPEPEYQHRNPFTLKSSMRTIVLAALLASASAAAAQEPFNWQGRIAAGKEIEIKGVIGDVRATASTGSEVQVSATRQRGREGNPQDVQIRVVEHEGGVTICSVYPGRGSNPSNQCDNGGGRDSNRANRDSNRDSNDTRVNFTVRVPAGVRFVGRTVVGDMDATGLRSDVDASTVSGNKRVSTTGTARASSVSGDVERYTTGYGDASTVSGYITATLGRGSWPEPLDFRTVSGKITLTLPATTAAQVRAQSMTGRIQSDFPLEIDQRRMQARATGTLGRGGRPLNLQTLSGDIRLRRAS
jgi:hypothetical protein